MKIKLRPLHKAALVFLFTLGILFVYAMNSPSFVYGNFSLKKAPMATLFNPPQLPQKKKKDSTPKIIAIKKEIPTIDSSRHRFLLVGDSQLEGLISPLSDYCKKNNDTLLASVIWYSSGTINWGSTDTLTYYIKKYKPTCVIMVLGMNEVIIHGVSERGPYVQNIIDQIDTLDYIWVGPACWKKDTGINDLLQQYVGDGKFFRTGEMKMARKKDGAHPTNEAARIWMDSTAVWMQNDCMYRFKMTKPEVTHTKRMGTTVLLTL